MSALAPAPQPLDLPARVRPNAIERARARAVENGKYPALKPGTDVWSVESSTKAGTFYDVRPAGETFLCSCEARGFCDHIAAVLICLERNVRAVYCECPNCEQRVYKTGDWCVSCRNLKAREDERLAYRARIAAELAAGIDPLAEAFA